MIRDSLRATAFLTLAWACSAPIGDDPGIHETGLCDIEVEHISGTDGAAEITPTEGIIVEFSSPVHPEGWLVELEGVPGEASLGSDRMSVVFRPDEPLEENAEYILLVSVCGEVSEYIIETSEVRYRADGTRIGQVIPVTPELRALVER